VTSSKAPAPAPAQAATVSAPVKAVVLACQSSLSGPAGQGRYLIHFFHEICHFFLEILRTFTGIYVMQATLLQYQNPGLASSPDGDNMQLQ
jgi:hypothetical protein